MPQHYWRHSPSRRLRSNDRGRRHILGMHKNTTWWRNHNHHHSHGRLDGPSYGCSNEKLCRRPMGISTLSGTHVRACRARKQLSCSTQLPSWGSYTADDSTFASAAEWFAPFDGSLGWLHIVGPACGHRRWNTNSSSSTSPSIYARFSSIQISDSCGVSMIPHTMIPFAPGELSTLERAEYIGTTRIIHTSSYDFKDLPCPPRAVAVSK